MTKIIQNDDMDLFVPIRLRTSSRPLLSALAVALILFLTSFGAAQNEDDEIKISTELVSFEVSVTDTNGNPIRGLSAADFKVLENGGERSIDFFQPIKKRDTARPLSVVFALDVSGSMTEEELQKLRAAMRNFVKRLADYESLFAITTFAMEVKTPQSFTNRPERLESAFEKLRRDQDGLSTHAYDAVDHAVRMIERKTPKTIRSRLPRRAVILITDGFPVGDVVSPQTVIERANQGETSVFSVILPSYSRLQRDKKPILTPLEASGLSEKTGGTTVSASEDNFQKIFDALADELTSSYAIAFYPPENSLTGDGFREVKILSKSGLKIRQNRSGYKPGQ